MISEVTQIEESRLALLLRIQLWEIALTNREEPQSPMALHEEIMKLKACSKG